MIDVFDELDRLLVLLRKHGVRVEISLPGSAAPAGLTLPVGFTKRELDNYGIVKEAPAAYPEQWKKELATLEKEIATLEKETATRKYADPISLVTDPPKFTQEELDGVRDSSAPGIEVTDNE